MERFLFRKIQVWVVLVLLFLGLLGVVAFGVVVRSRTLGYHKFGVAGEIAYALASSPDTLQKILRPYDRMIAQHYRDPRFPGRRGWEVKTPASAAAVDGYLLLSRYDGDARRHIVELVDLSTLETPHSWMPDSDALFDGFVQGKEYNNLPVNAETFRILHPYLMENGDLIVKGNFSPMARVDACAQKVWVNSDLFHHSTERAADGTFWIPGDRDPAELEHVPPTYYNDSLTQITEDGEVLYSKSLTTILIENGYEYLLTSMNAGYSDDPIHLNDIEPLLQDGPYWKRGDLLISMRHKSAIMLFRPSTNEILWLRSGPWAFQHDVDVLGDGRIAVFNNNMRSRHGGPVVDPSNDVVIYDFATDTVSTPYSDIMLDADIRTVSEGLYTFLPGGQLMVEESDYGRILFFDQDGKIALEYVNGGSSGVPYRLGWVRYVTREYGDAALSNIRKSACDGG
ncbi:MULTISPECIES: arylsulfotransferase family protein [Actibacterium]|uniref:Arylsulfotransferase (ASST) n=1 Tax=Actibacterium naphthalenivorans TaxID=1614693 RepID=A0A840C6F2_9RHOB|nr:MULTISPECIES: arylsulfotransferase family protein [Actibacterium]ALG89663.1 hypothetical protein TQ29_04995 [Actibacterium sp. EMB200-NS6]MBB4020660.1 hypothetical protein [Actibacterium naphthalenivorans]